MNRFFKAAAVQSILLGAVLFAYCRNKTTNPSPDGGPVVNPNDFVGVYSESFPWRFPQVADHVPQLLRYYAIGGITFENGKYLNLHYTQDKTEGKECIQFLVPSRGGNDGALQNLQVFLLFRTFTTGSSAPTPAMDWSKFPYFTMWIRGPGGFSGRIGLGLKSQDPSSTDPNDERHPSQDLLFPQTVTDAWTRVSLDLRTFTDVDPSRILFYSIQFQTTQEGKTFLIDDILLAKNPPGGGGGNGEPVGSDDENYTETLAIRSTQAEFQAIDGFGFFGGTSKPEWLITEMGTTMVRTEVPADFEPSNENADPDDLDLSRFNTSALDGALASLRAYKNLLPDVKVIASVWSPPGWMKLSGQVGGGDQNPAKNKLKAELVPEFAEYCVAYARAMNQNGIGLYGLCLQNEPYFSHDFPSCQYTSQEIVDLVEDVGARFEAEAAKGDGFAAPLLFEPEHVLGDYFLGEINNFINLLDRNADAKRFVERIALHAYTENATNPANIPNTLWGRAAAAAARIQKPLWMTETSGYEVSLNGALQMVEGVYTSLTYGSVQAWVHFGADGAFTAFSERTDLFYALKQVFRFVRPGAVRVDASIEGTMDLLPLCFRNADGSVVIVVINKGRTAVGVLPRAFRRLGQDRFSVYRTSEHNKCKKMGEAGIDETVVCVGRSITTLYAGPAMPGTE
jgi:O-glycosyl hydrolase